MSKTTYSELRKGERNLQVQRDIVDGVAELQKRQLTLDIFEEKRNGSPEPIVVLDIDALRTRPQPEWIVPGLLQDGTIAVLAAQAGLGKTFLALHLAGCVVTGMPFFGRPVKMGSVLYVIAEGAASIVNRLDAWESYHSMTIPQEDLGFIETGVDLMSAASMRNLEATILEFQPDLIVLDTLSQLASIDNENDAAQMAAVFRQAKKLRQLVDGSTVLLVHHVNKSSGALRGSSVIRSNADTVLMARAATGHTFELTTEASHDGKQKDAPAETLRGFELVSHGASAVVTCSGVAAPDELWLKVLDVLKDGDWHTAKEVKTALGVEANGSKEYKAYTDRMKHWVATGSVEERGSTQKREYQLPAISWNPLAPQPLAQKVEHDPVTLPEDLDADLAKIMAFNPSK
jgi:hypothetical protein